MKQLRNFKDLIRQWAKRKRVTLIVSLFNMLILSLFSYILNNQSVFTGEDLNQFAWMQILKNKLGIEQQMAKDSVLLVNVAYDKQLIEMSDEFDIPIGNTDITDRKKLLTFLQMLNATKKYKYIFLDVRFEKGYNVIETDSLLFSEINSMKNIVVAKHSDMEIANSILLNKAAISDYDATIFSTNFVRYKYSYDDKQSVPLYAYNELIGKNINKTGFIYTCNGKLCYNSLFIDFPIDNFNEFDNNNKKKYYNLGSDLIDCYTEQDIATLTNEKYVVIGNMIDDLHDTYSGLKPGSVITFYAFQSLMEGKHFVKKWIVILMAIIYFTISVSLFNYRSIKERIPCVRKSKSKLIHFILSFGEYTLLLLFVSIILNLFWNISTSIILPSIYFAIQKNIIKYKRTEI